MSAAGVLQAIRGAAQRRAVAIALARSLPWLLALAALLWRFSTPAAAASALLLGAAGIAALAWRRARAFDTRWLVRALDAHRAALEDSSDLLLADPARMSALERLQRARVEARLQAQGAPDLRPPWPLAPILAGAAAAIAIGIGALLWPRAPQADAAAISAETSAASRAPAAVQLRERRLEIAPPAYTRLPARRSDELDAKVPEGARLRWQLRFAPAPQRAELRFLDGRRLPLRRDSETWSAQTRIDRAGLYRVHVDGAPLKPERLHRIDVRRDAPPQIRVTAPDRNLSLRAAGQRQWPLAFEASDDYGLDAGAELRITTAQGTGENVTFREQTRTLAGSGGATRRRFATRLDLDALGLAEGDDVVVQFTVCDNRAGAPQTARSASYILRWPLPQAQIETGLDGLMKKTLPAYFRSQRQIIIDAEALLKQQPKLAQDAFVQRSDAIGVDQRLLRLRYGQFLGEESEGAPQRPLLPTNDAEDEAERAAHDHDHDHDGDGDIDAADDAAHAWWDRVRGNQAETGAPTTSTAPPSGAPRAQTQAAPDAHGHEHGHDHGAPAAEAAPGFGRDDGVIAEFGHLHDLPEAATLLDPETRETLRAALREMWQSELHLRQGRPDAALPYAYKALDLIKQVQQSSRIYLARVGYEQAPIDESRRLSGERSGVSDRRDLLAAAPVRDPEPAALWRALDATGDAEAVAPALTAFEAWLGRNESRVRDPLAIAAALDALRREPDCADCRARLRGQLWPLLDPRRAAPPPRAEADRGGRAYLEALQRMPAQ